MNHWKLLQERFGKDSLIALATVDPDGIPWVRTVNACFWGDSFYIITYAVSSKMKQIAFRPLVAVSGDWFTGHGTAENLGHILLEQNEETAKKLRAAFASWYENGHTNEADPNTIILRIRLKDGILFDHGTRIEFTL